MKIIAVVCSVYIILAVITFIVIYIIEKIACRDINEVFIIPIYSLNILYTAIRAIFFPITILCAIIISIIDIK